VIVGKQALCHSYFFRSRVSETSDYKYLDSASLYTAGTLRSLLVTSARGAALWASESCADPGPLCSTWCSSGQGQSGSWDHSCSALARVFAAVSPGPRPPGPHRAALCPACPAGRGLAPTGIGCPDGPRACARVGGPRSPSGPAVAASRGNRSSPCAAPRRRGSSSRTRLLGHKRTGCA